jgi:hypothetical protein
VSVQKVGRGATYRRPVQGPATWAALIALGAALEAAALRGKKQEHTLSHATRLFFRTTTPAGRVSFVSAWVALSAWFVSHILTDPEEGR